MWLEQKGGGQRGEGQNPRDEGRADHVGPWSPLGRILALSLSITGAIAGF